MELPDLFPVFDVPDMEPESQSENKTVYSACFDYELGDFVLSPTGTMIEATPFDSWAQWCVKVVYSERYTLSAYGRSYGAEFEDAFREPTRAAQESAIERTITETVMADPYQRTVYVRDFIFDWGVDSVEVTFTIGGICERETTLSVNLARKG